MQQLKDSSPRLKQLTDTIGYVLFHLSCLTVAYVVLGNSLIHQIALRAFELFHVVLLLILFSQKNTISLPMPINPKYLTTRWLTEVLQVNFN